MKAHSRTIIVCTTILLVAVVLAVSLRYKTYSKSGWNMVIQDRWTGEMRLCDRYGCYTQAELRANAEVAAQRAADTSSAEVTALPPSPEQVARNAARAAGEAGKQAAKIASQIMSKDETDSAVPDSSTEAPWDQAGE